MRLAVHAKFIPKIMMSTKKTHSSRREGERSSGGVKNIRPLIHYSS